MDYLERNRRSWNSGVMSTSVWAQPVDAATIAAARAGRWQVLLTPRTPVPRAWLAGIEGRSVLCLASGGGQQAPVLAAAGAGVVSFDLSDEQLRKDRQVAEREGLDIRCVRGDMADLGCFDDASFDLIFHPASNVFVRDLAPVWRECHRVLRPGGTLLAGFMNPAVFLFDHDEADATGDLVVRYTLPYSDEHSLPADRLDARIDAGEPLEFGHSLAAQIGGQTDAGFLIAGLYEDHWFDETWAFSNRSPVCIATRALRPLAA
jgi:SAM-dependent methyltransferase